MSKYFFRKPVLINGVEKDSVDIRPLMVADMRRVNKGTVANQSVRMIAAACGVAPTDVEGFKSRDFVALKGEIIDALHDEGEGVDYVPNEDDVIVVELMTPIQLDSGAEITQVSVNELTTAQSISAERVARGDDFELVFMRMRASCGLSVGEMERMSMADFQRVGEALSVFFVPPEKS